MTGKQPSSILPDHLPVADGHEIRAPSEPVNREMIDDLGDVFSSARVLHVKEDGAAPDGEWPLRLGRHSAWANSRSGSATTISGSRTGVPSGR